MPGTVEYFDGQRAYGWFRESEEAPPARIQLYWRGELVSEVTSDIPRSDVGPSGFEMNYSIPGFTYWPVTDFTFVCVTDDGRRFELPVWSQFITQLSQDFDQQGSCIAFLFMCYRAPDVMAETLRVLDNQRDRFIAHVDAKVDMEAFATLREWCPSLRFLEQRTDVKWGTFSMMSVEFELIRQALLDEQVERIVLLSDDTFPLSNLDTVRRRLMLAEFGTDGRKLRPDDEYFMSRYEDFRFFGHNAANEKIRFTIEDTDGILDLMYWIRRGKKPLELYHGSQWWTLTRDQAKAILQATEDEHLMASFRYSMIPDEHFVQTVLGSGRVQQWGPMHTEWPVAGEFSGPRTFAKVADLEHVLSSQRLFVRKIAPGATEVVEALKAHIAGQ